MASVAIGEAPAHLDEMEREIWSELISICPAGVLTGADRIALESMCRLVKESRVSPDEISVGKLQLLRTYLGQFGLTPADRAKIAIPPPEPENPFDEF